MARVRADYKVVGNGTDIVYLVDKNCGNMSVTNDAENVVLEVTERFGNKRIMYKDSMDRWDELVHDHGQFVRFAPGHEPPHGDCC